MSTEVLLVEPRGQAHVKLSNLTAPRLRVAADIRAALTRVRASSLWIVTSELALDLLLASLPRRPRQRDLRLLTFKRFPSEFEGLLHAHFRFLVSAENRIKLLPLDELTEVLSSENRRDLLIGGEFIPARSEILLYRGDLEPITVPLSWFSPRPGSPEPDATRLAVTDYGQTVRLGEYEAAADAILYEFDEDYRPRAKKRMLEKDTSLGGAIRRLRLQKGLRQTDFPGITAKEIARIEKGLVQRPREETLQRIAKRTGVLVDQLQTY